MFFLVFSLLYEALAKLFLALEILIQNKKSDFLNLAWDMFRD